MDYLWFFYQLFALSFWWHPFTAEDPLVSKWCNATFLKIFSDEETNSVKPEDTAYRCKATNHSFCFYVQFKDRLIRNIWYYNNRLAQETAVWIFCSAWEHVVCFLLIMSNKTLNIFQRFVAINFPKLCPNLLITCMAIGVYGMDR